VRLRLDLSARGTREVCEMGRRARAVRAQPMNKCLFNIILLRHYPQFCYDFFFKYHYDKGVSQDQKG
jgi:hypothetical protein